jgi:hypothetical protein
MSQSKGNAILIMRRLAEALQAIADEDLRKLDNPQYAIEVKVVRKRTHDEAQIEKPVTGVTEAISHLERCATRQDGQDFLSKNFLTKKTLEEIARRLDISINKNDKSETLRDRIVEATVGARIRSQAIQGGDVAGSSAKTAEPYKAS